MKTIKLTLLPLICITATSCQQGIAGLYKSNFAVYGSFTESLQLNCDSSFAYQSNVDFEHESIQGKWSFKDAHILVLPDTANKYASKLAGKKWFYQKRRLLAFSPSDYKYFVADILRIRDSAKAKDASSTVIDIPEPNTALAGGYGKLKLYYLKKIKGENCTARR